MMLVRCVRLLCGRMPLSLVTHIMGMKRCARWTHEVVFAEVPEAWGVNMICVKCGSVLPDGAEVCDVCGAVQPAATPKSSVSMHRLKGIGIGAGIGVAVVLAFAIPSIAMSPNGMSSAIGSETGGVITQSELIVPVQAVGLDGNGSRIAVKVTGLTSTGSKVDEEGFINNDGKGLSLQKGMYEVKVLASPITSSGTIFSIPEESVSIEVNDDGGSSYTSDKSLVLTPIDAAAVTDEQIAAAHAAILKDPERSAIADRLAESVRQNRAAAQAAGKSRSEGKDKKDEESQSNDSDNAKDSSSQSDSNGNQSDSDNNPYSNYNPSSNSNSDNSNNNYQPYTPPAQDPAPAPAPAEPAQQESSGGSDAGGDSSSPVDGGGQTDPAPPDGGSVPAYIGPDSGSGSGSSDSGASSGSSGSSSAAAGADAGTASGAAASTVASTTTSGAQS